ncbi:MAG: group 1 truncated hemoglobin [Candidatus Nitrohelix vancouverensis]|uniref:Group 1 truncated hemoglobin n=1 Tax=Candidatus Nitrohelix vancouverensis TaxID=2705534 RepID=A0A7T0G2R7_9BACT|nr:MAG: group 1 truncated hemoglobin [Candidatus Nitrohelix vancouverensis]
MSEGSLFDRLGGRPTFEKVHKVFYDKIYEHPWLAPYFKGVDQKTIENQQTDFMISNMGGGRVYSGRFPKPAHQHMNISAELFEVRNCLLQDSLKECDIPQELAEQWLKIDYAFKHSLVKSGAHECVKRFFTDEILDFPKPSG